MKLNDVVLSEPLMLKAGESRGPGCLEIFTDRVSIKLSGSDTSGTHAMMEITTAPQSGPPLHRHDREDESFYILEGEYEFEVDGTRVLAGPGCSLFAPRGVSHAFRNVGSSAGRMLIVVQPAGLDEFFKEYENAVRGQQEPNMSVVIPLFRRYGLELLGPPIGN